MRRSLGLTFLLLAACSARSSGSDGRKPGAAEDDSANASGSETLPDGAVVATDEAGLPIADPVANDGGATQAPPNKPPPYVNFDTMISAMRDDVRRIENPAERTDVRYLVVSHLGNAGLSNAELAVHRSTMNLLVNSVSRGQVLVAPVQLAAAPNVYRINLRDYRWTAALWETVVADYPYQVQYNQDSKVYPRDETSAKALRDATGTAIPFVFMEWFTSKVVRAPLYYQLLNFPDTLTGLADQVGVEIDKDILEERVARAGVTSSEFAKENRMLERHSRVGNAGTFWLSYDFSQSTGVQNIVSHPLDFQHAGGEVIYALPNGLSAYMVVDASGKRLDAAPFALVADTRAPGGIAAPGLSCMGGCHYEKGFESIVDQVRTPVLAASPAGVDLETIRAIFPTQDKLDALLAADSKGYVAAATSIGVDLSLANAPYQTVEFYQGAVDLPLAAALLEITEAEMESALRSAPITLPGPIFTLRDGKVLSRRSFEELFAQTVCSLGIGEPLCAARACGCATLKP